MADNLRVPTYAEYIRLAEVTHGRDTKMHWRGIQSWVSDARQTAHSGKCRGVCGGLNHARRRVFNHLETFRHRCTGFRPICDLAPETMSSEGSLMVMGTLYMAGEPVKVPKNPTFDGDITAYIPGAKLEMREPLPIPDYQVMGYRTGNMVVADRCILNRISYVDIKSACRLPAN